MQSGVVRIIKHKMMVEGDKNGNTFKREKGNAYQLILRKDSANTNTVPNMWRKQVNFCHRSNKHQRIFEKAMEVVLWHLFLVKIVQIRF